MRAGRRRSAVLLAAPLLAGAVLAASCDGPAPAASNNLPGIVEVISPATGSGTLVIFLSGIAGWGGIDRQSAGLLGEAGHTVVALDSPDWFSQRRPAAEVAAHLAAIIDAHEGPAGAERIVLAGYSFGANALPPAWNALDPVRQADIAAVILIAPNRRAREIIDLRALLGLSLGPADLAPELARIPADKLVCIYPQAERATSGCTLAGMERARVVQLPGGHTFNGDAKAVAAEIETVLAGLQSG